MVVRAAPALRCEPGGAGWAVREKKTGRITIGAMGTEGAPRSIVAARGAVTNGTCDHVVISVGELGKDGGIPTEWGRSPMEPNRAGAGS